MLIFLDTTDLKGQYRLASPDLEKLQIYLRTTGHKLWVPSIVFEESAIELVNGPTSGFTCWQR